jgi:hypothetical protein
MKTSNKFDTMGWDSVVIWLNSETQNNKIWQKSYFVWKNSVGLRPISQTVTAPPPLIVRLLKVLSVPFIGAPQEKWIL